MLIVVERRETFHYYYPMGVHPPGDLTVTYYQTFKGEEKESTHSIKYGGRYFLTVSTSIAMLKDQRLLFNAFVQKQYVETLCFSKVPFTVFKGQF